MVDVKQLEKGIKIEMEHTKSKKVAKKIALEHLEENVDYYKEVRFGKRYVEKLVSVKRKKLQVQTLIFDKEVFKKKKQVRNWIKKEGFNILKSIDEKKNTFRVRQREPYKFIKKTFRTFKIGDGVKATGGKLK